MTTLGDLANESIPQSPAPAPARPRPNRPAWTPEEQDQHWDDLCKAIGVRNERRPRTSSPNAQSTEPPHATA